MAEWIKYDGSDEQIAEIVMCRHGVLLRKGNVEVIIRYGELLFNIKDFLKNVTHYLICNPHPLADMICQQARTGQYVWIKVFNATAAVDAYEFVSAYAGYSAYKTTKPNWNISGAEYSFTEFRD